MLLLMIVCMYNYIHYTYTVSPEVNSLDDDQLVTANISQSAVLSFQININAYPPIRTSNIHWFYSPDKPPTLHATGFQFQEITHLANRTRESTLTFSGDRFTLTINNLVPAQPDDPDTDSGRYFLQATNEAGVDSSYIDLIVFGKKLYCMHSNKIVLCFDFGFEKPVETWPRFVHYTSNCFFILM